MKILILFFPLYALAGQPGGYLSKPTSCSYLKKCSAEKACEDASDECFDLSACGESVCLSEKQACVKECGTVDCKVMESFPARVSCE